MGKKYSFVTHWELKGSLQQVWDAIYNSLEWPQWWHGVKKVTEIEKNDSNGINGIRKYTWKSFLPYELTFTMRLTENNYLKHIKAFVLASWKGRVNGFLLKIMV